MNTSKLQSANISRDYVSSYARALESEKVDGKLFSDIQAQRRFFTRKLNDAKGAHRDNLNAAIAQLTAAQNATTDKKERAEIDLAVSAVALELASL